MYSKGIIKLIMSFIILNIRCICLHVTRAGLGQLAVVF